jgi:hypothetical protein
MVINAKHIDSLPPLFMQHLLDEVDQFVRRLP